MTWYDDREHNREHNGEHEDATPLYSKRRRTILRITVLVCVAALLLPGILSLYSHFAAFAHAACIRAAVFSDPTTRAARASFEVFGPGGIGWECYATGAGSERHVASLGLFPADVTPSGPTDRARSGTERQSLLTVATGASADNRLGRQSANQYRP